jgi:hypothetical protein
MKIFYCYLITTSSSFWAFVYDSAEKTNVKHDLIGYWTTKERVW